MNNEEILEKFRKIDEEILEKFRKIDFEGFDYCFSEYTKPNPMTPFCEQHINYLKTKEKFRK